MKKVLFKRNLKKGAALICSFISPDNDVKILIFCSQDFLNVHVIVSISSLLHNTFLNDYLLQWSEEVRPLIDVINKLYNSGLVFYNVVCMASGFTQSIQS